MWDKLSGEPLYNAIGELHKMRLELDGSVHNYVHLRRAINSINNLIRFIRT